MLLPCQSQAVTLSLHFTLYLPGLEIVLCLWSVYRDQREGWAGLAAGVWLNNSGYWQSGAGLLTSHIPADDPQHRAQYQPQSWRFSLVSAWIHIAPFSGTKLLNLALTGTYSKWKSSYTTGAVHKWGRIITFQIRRCNIQTHCLHTSNRIYIKRCFNYLEV